MAKFSDIIERAKQGEAQKTSEPENQKTIEPVALKAGKPENQKDGILENQVKAEIVKDEEVNLSIKVSKKRRQHWAAEAKRRGTTITAVITEALSAKFGEPAE